MTKGLDKKHIYQEKTKNLSQKNSLQFKTGLSVFKSKNLF